MKLETSAVVSAKEVSEDELREYFAKCSILSQWIRCEVVEQLHGQPNVSIEDPAPGMKVVNYS